MKKLCTGTLLVGFLCSPAAHATGGDELIASTLELKGSQALGEADALESGRSGAGLPALDDAAGLALTTSELVGGVPLGGSLEPPEPAQALDTPPSVSSPTTSSPSSTAVVLPVVSAPQVDGTAKHTAAKSPVTAQVGSAMTDNADQGERWGIAPIQWGGDVSETLRWRRYTTSTDSPAVNVLDNMQMINLRASSYFWQPWIAEVNGGIGLLHNSQATGGSYTSNGTTWTGNGAVSLFPRSRFPFRASYDISDSRTSMVLTNSDYRSRRVGLEQDYRTVSGDSSMAVNLDRSTLSSASFGDDVVTALRGNYSTRFGAGNTQSASLNVFHTESSQQQGNANLNLNGFTAQHGYHPDPLLSIDTNASLSDSVSNSGTTTTSSSTARFLQANTYVNWRPDEEKPLNFFGGARLLDGLSKYANTSTNSQSIGGNVGVNYNPTRNIGLNAAGSVTRVNSGDKSSVSTLQSANAAYNADPINFKNNLSYNWNANGGLSNQTNSDTANDQRISGMGSHSLYYPYSISEASMMNFTATQSLSSYYDRIYGGSGSLNHVGAITWSGNQSESLSGSANFAIGDMHTIGYNESNYQYANLQVNAKKQFTMTSLMTATGGVNWDRQGLSGRTTTTINSSISYQNTRAFNVRGLRYSLVCSANNTSYNERLQGNVDAPRSLTGYSLEQYLNYRIGKLDTSLSAILAEYDHRQNASIFVRIGRNFGNM